VKNTLSTVQAIASQTIRSAPTPADFREAFEARLQALSRAHDLLVRTQWEGAELGSILADEFRPYGPDRVTIKGPAVTLPAREALAVSLVVHELTTNAAKYGGLSTPGGRLSVTWRVVRGEAGRALDLTWSERGGPRLAGPPERKGFGSRLIERSIGRDLGGRQEAEFAPEGLTCRIAIPIPPVGRDAG